MNLQSKDFICGIICSSYEKRAAHADDLKLFRPGVELDHYCKGFDRDFMIPGKKLLHFFRYIFREGSFVYANHIGAFFILSNGIAVGSILKYTAFQLIVESFDQRLT